MFTFEKELTFIDHFGIVHLWALKNLRWTLTAGQCHDITQAPALIQGYSCQSVISDKGYDSDAFAAEITIGVSLVVFQI